MNTIKIYVDDQLILELNDPMVPSSRRVQCHNRLPQAFERERLAERYYELENGGL